jgi:non-specific protein-tyrosine kinase
MLAAGIVFLVEYLDDTLKTPEDVQRVLGLPVLGFVAQMRHARKGAEEVFVTQQPRSPVTEGFRTLRTNLEFAAVEKPICTVLVTSPGPSEGKTTVAANLAAIFSQAQKRVLLLDADMRRPRIHRLLGMANRSGLSNLFLGHDHREGLGRRRPDLPNLLVVTSGGLPPNPAELLGSAKMDQILNEIRKHAEVVVIDTPPSLVADAQILAGKVDAVVLVIQPGKTHAEAARACLETLNRSGARIVGVVMNRIPRNRSYYYGGYKYYAARGDKGYYSTKEAERPVEEPTRKPMDRPVRQPLPRGEQAPARMAAQEPVSSPLRRLLQAQATLPAGKPDEDTKPSPVRQPPELEQDYPDESFLSVPSVHKLFEDLEVAPNAAPLQASKQDNPDSFFRRVFPRDDSRGEMEHT